MNYFRRMKDFFLSNRYDINVQLGRTHAMV